MNKQIYKWTAILMLAVLCMVSAYTYDNLFRHFSTDFDTTPDTPVVDLENTPPAVTPDTPEYTVFPKAPLLAPFNNAEFMQSVGGTGDDVILSGWVQDTTLYVIGETNSNDYDFACSQKSVFVGVLTLNGTLLSTYVLPDSTTFLDCVLFNGSVAVFYRNDTSAHLAFVNTDGVFYNLTLPFLPDTLDCVLGGDGAYFLSLCDTSLCISRVDRYFNLTTTSVAEGVTSFLPLQYINSSLSFIFNTPLAMNIAKFSLDFESEAISSVTTTTPLVAQSCVPAFFNDEQGFVVSLARGEDILCYGVTLSGKTVWSQEIAKGTSSCVLKSNDGYLLFVSDGVQANCVKLCSHGDIITSSVLAFSSLMPVEYFYTENALVVLLSSPNKEGGHIATFDSADTSSVVYSFDAVLPSALLPLENGNLLLLLSANKDTPGFGSCVGERDGFIICLK